MGHSPTLRLKRLSMEAFRSFVDRTEVTLPERGLHLVQGLSGAGKSAFTQAIAYALDYSDFPATTHQSWDWLTDKSMEVDLAFEVGGVEMGVRRGKKASFSPGPLVPAKVGASVVKTELPKALGIEPAMLKALTYRPQRQTGLFLSMLDSEKKSFLTSLLHLSDAEREVEKTQKAITTLEEQVKVAQARAEQATALVPPEPATPALKPVEDLEQKVTHHETSVEEAKRQLADARTRLRSLLDQQEAEVKGAARHWDSVISNHKAAMQKLIVGWNASIATAKTKTYALDPESAAKLEKLKSRLKVIQDGATKFQAEHKATERSKRAAIEERRKHLWSLEAAAKTKAEHEQKLALALGDLRLMEANTCPTCEQTWKTDTLLDSIQTKQMEVDAAKSAIQVAEDAAAAAAETRATLLAAEEDLAKHSVSDPVPEKFRAGEKEYQGLIADLAAEQKAAFSTFQAERARFVAELEKQMAQEVGALRDELHGFETQRAEAVAKAGPAHAAIEAARAGVEQWAEDVRDADARLIYAKGALDQVRHTNRLNLEDFDRQMAGWKRLSDAARVASDAHADRVKLLAVEQDFLALLKSFLALVFDETLQSIAAKANELLVGVPNVAGMTLDFTSEHETKTTGSVRQEIRLVVRKDGHEVPFRAGCSGGQQATVELAVDLALAEVIAERTGVYPGWLILDEPFDGLDSASKEACMEVLSRVGQERAIFVIDHAVEVKEMFDSVFTIEHHEGRSTLRQ